MVQAFGEALYSYNSHFSPKSDSKKRTNTVNSLSIISWMTEICELLGDAAKWTIGKVFCTSFRSFAIPFETEGNSSKFIGTIFIVEE